MLVVMNQETFHLLRLQFSRHLSTVGARVRDNGPNTFSKNFAPNFSTSKVKIAMVRQKLDAGAPELPGVGEKRRWFESLVFFEVARCFSARKLRDDCEDNCKRASQDIELMTAACKNKLA